MRSPGINATPCEKGERREIMEKREKKTLLKVELTIMILDPILVQITYTLFIYYKSDDMI